MRLVVPVVFLAACGGSPPPPPAAPVEQPKQVTRVPVEDDTDTQEEGVTFVKTKGAISQEQIQAGIAPHQQELADCYMSKVGKRRWLGGHVVIQWNLEADGTLSSVKLTESNLGSWDIEQCMVDVAWQATFGKPAGGKVDFTVPLDFSAKGGTQIWDEDKALRAVGGQLASLDDCDDFELTRGAKKPKAKKRPPADKSDQDERPEKPPTNVVVTMYVGPGGKLQSVGFASPTAEVGHKWAACAEQAASTWRLPDPRGQIAKLAIRYKPSDESTDQE
jgi:hypothetical protein